jgi:hypothetical protein
MTLPGIAGFVLTMGIGVDSNVLISSAQEELGRAASAPRSMPASTAYSGRWSTRTSRRSSCAFLFQFAWVRSVASP